MHLKSEGKRPQQKGSNNPIYIGRERRISTKVLRPVRQEKSGYFQSVEVDEPQGEILAVPGIYRRKAMMTSPKKTVMNRRSQSAYLIFAGKQSWDTVSIDKM